MVVCAFPNGSYLIPELSKDIFAVGFIIVAIIIISIIIVIFTIMTTLIIFAAFVTTTISMTSRRCLLSTSCSRDWTLCALERRFQEAKESIDAVHVVAGWHGLKAIGEKARRLLGS